jgi:hypothetical protein
VSGQGDGRVEPEVQDDAGRRARGGVGIVGAAEPDAADAATQTGAREAAHRVGRLRPTAEEAELLEEVEVGLDVADVKLGADDGEPDVLCFVEHVDRAFRKGGEAVRIVSCRSPRLRRRGRTLVVIVVVIRDRRQLLVLGAAGALVLNT